MPIMQQKHLPAPAPYEESAKRDHLLAAIRCASLHLLLSKCEMDAVGTALRGNLIGVDEAIDWLEDLGAMPLIGTVVDRSHA